MTKIYGLSSGTALEKLARIGVVGVNINVYESIPNGANVLIYDCNGTIDIDILKYLINNACCIRYVFEEDGLTAAKFLESQNVFDIYGDIGIGGLDSNFVMMIFKNKKTKNEVKESKVFVGEVNSVNVCMEVVQNFIDAINSKDKDKIEEIYNNDFWRMLKVHDLFMDSQAEKEKYRRETEAKEVKMQEIIKEDKKIKNENQRILDTSKLLEVDNKKLAEGVLKSTETVGEKNEFITNIQEQLSEVTYKLTKKIDECKEFEREKDISSSNYTKVKAQHDTLLSKVDRLQETLKNTSVKSNNITVNIINTATVKKILYIKVVDQIPYLVSSIVNYLKYTRNRLDSCGMVVIFPNNSVQLDQYRDEFILMKDDMEAKDSNANVYMMQDFSSCIEDYIKTCGTEFVIILDTTGKRQNLIKTVRQKVVYVVNSEETITRNNLNPRDCISYRNMKQVGVMAQVPTVTDEELSARGKYKITLRENLFTPMDSWW